MRFDLSSSATRYFVASVVALGLDMGFTLLLYHNTPMWMWFSAALSFLVVGFVFYFVHEFWSFQRNTSAFSMRRLRLNLMVLAGAAGARMLVIGLLELWRTPGLTLSILYFVAGAAVSFTINFFINRYWVFVQSDRDG